MSASTTPDSAAHPKNDSTSPERPQQVDIQTPVSFSTCPLPSTFSLVLNYRKGRPTSSRRALKDLPASAPWVFERDADTYRVLIARIEGYISRLQGVRLPRNWRPYLKPTNNTYQRNFVELTNDNFAKELERTWRKEARRTNNLNGDGIELQLYVYLEDVVNAKAAAGNNGVCQTATQPIQSQAVEQSIIPDIGPSTQMHLMRHIANPSTVPARKVGSILKTNTDRQAHDPDERKREFKDKQRAMADLQAEYRMIEININGIDLPISVKLSSLQKALNLPLSVPSK
ncbi:hypothetical protein BGZ99_009427 [Dissophora globulifera]|uniref:Uncharacterized protein n=1 Tax=Dissophora globulifera TaxID=979702 RepID=A0A9P6RWZ7_9FUNG|nr:hypothetical protein BGZ99_009427 [Dissophora globulifera]